MEACYSFIQTWSRDRMHHYNVISQTPVFMDRHDIDGHMTQDIDGHMTLMDT